MNRLSIDFLQLRRPSFTQQFRHSFSATCLLSSSKLQSPRVPLRILDSPSFKPSLSPLVDPNSPLSLPESEADRLRWLDRFTPRWNETCQQRRARFRQRTLSMLRRRAHTEKLLNSFQRLDAFTGTVLPSDFLISLSFARWQDPQPTSPSTRSQKIKKSSDSGPGTYLTPNRILHPYWLSKKNGLSVWVFCHRDVLKQPKKLRTLYRYVQEPKFSPHLADQISSQLARRIVQECMVLSQALKGPFSSSQDVRSANTSIRSKLPTLASEEALLNYIQGCFFPPQQPAITGRFLPFLGGLLVLSQKLFLKILQTNFQASPPPEEATVNKILTISNPAMMMFSLSLPGGPVPVWNLQGLLEIMIKVSPHKVSDSLITSAIKQSTSISSHSNLVETLMNEIHSALHSNTPTIQSLNAECDKAYLIPLSEATYPLILALRRATWWIGQGFEPEHFSHLDVMTEEATERKQQRQKAWENWLARRSTVTGKIVRDGELWIPVSGDKNQEKRWRRV
ncbi:hypothetical protein O181_002456 [Austropuccinia psidii MF-1]|uniref:Uncharacterized protein n=1 Tax=Austropuccinia psidii MF-1 TaxID=1389203 RepID=A0A9Q3BD11_9BASI|nr:hypothetical protein [Austropuccinia psidii MF-1]